jgi:two-component system, NarL family, sensor histidine kinase UhpB
MKDKMVGLLRILIVEDSEDDTLLLVRQLEKDGYELTYERVDTPEGLEAALGKQPWDVVITDYVLPQLSGLDAIKTVAKINADLPCIVVSGKITDEIAVSAMKAGARDYVMKDNLKRIGPAIERELAEAENLRQRRRAEQEIKENENRLQKLFESLDEGVALISPSGRVILANAAEAKILGLKSPMERINRPFRSPDWKLVRIDGSPLPLEETGVMTAIKTKRTVRNFEMGILRDDGSTLWLNVNAVPILDEAGAVTSVVRTLTDISEQKKLQDEREQFARRLIEVQEEERKRISRELHDDTAQYLALLALEMDSLFYQKEPLSEGTKTKIKQLRNTTEQVLKEIRRFSHELRPSVLEHFGLVSGLELITSEFNNNSQIEARFNVSGSEKRLSDQVELTLFRIAQEALSNVRKHSQASYVKVELRYTPMKVRLIISDDGKGFDSSGKNVPDATCGLGMVGMRERAHLCGGKLRIKSTPGMGTKITVEVPNIEAPLKESKSA